MTQVLMPCRITSSSLTYTDLPDFAFEKKVNLRIVKNRFQENAYWQAPGCAGFMSRASSLNYSVKVPT
jgi:hypothetical protein